MVSYRGIDWNKGNLFAGSHFDVGFGLEAAERKVLTNWIKKTQYRELAPTVRFAVEEAKKPEVKAKDESKDEAPAIVNLDDGSPAPPEPSAPVEDEDIFGGPDPAFDDLAKQLEEQTKKEAEAAAKKEVAAVKAKAPTEDKEEAPVEEVAAVVEPVEEEPDTLQSEEPEASGIEKIKGWDLSTSGQQTRNEIRGELKDVTFNHWQEFNSNNAVKQLVAFMQDLYGEEVNGNVVKGEMWNAYNRDRSKGVDIVTTEEIAAAVKKSENKATKKAKRKKK